LWQACFQRFKTVEEFFLVFKEAAILLVELLQAPFMGCHFPKRPDGEHQRAEKKYNPQNNKKEFISHKKCLLLLIQEL